MNLLQNLLKNTDKKPLLFETIEAFRAKDLQDEKIKENLK
jgi:hypothetical protein